MKFAYYLSFPDSFAYMLTIYGYGDNEEGSAGVRRYPLNYIFSGEYYWGDGKLYTQDIRGHLHSSTAYDTQATYYLYIGSGRVLVDDNVKYHGRSVRCIFYSIIPTSQLPQIPKNNHNRFTEQFYKNRKIVQSSEQFC